MRNARDAMRGGQAACFGKKKAPRTVGRPFGQSMKPEQ